MLTIRLSHLQIGLIGLLPFLFLFLKKFPCLIILPKTKHYIQVEGIGTLVFLPILEGSGLFFPVQSNAFYRFVKHILMWKDVSSF